MRFIREVLKNDSGYISLEKDIISSFLPVAASGLSKIHKVVVAAALNDATNKKIIMLTQDEASANDMRDDLVSLNKKVVYFPARDYSIGNFSGYSREYEHKRIETLSVIAGGDFEVLVLSIDAALQYTVPKKILEDSCFEITSGASFRVDELVSRLLKAGYSRSPLTEGYGQFSVRGGIVDLFPVNSDEPLRVEFWGDEIDNLSYFDIESQRRIKNIESIKISPAHEVICDPVLLAETLEEYRSNNKRLTENQKTIIGNDIEALESELTIPLDRYIQLIYPENQSIFDYFDEPLVLVCESGNINERIKSLTWQISEDTSTYLEEGFLSKSTAKLYFEKAELLLRLEKAVYLENFPRSSYEIPLKNIINFDYKRSTPWSGDLNVLIEDISYILSQKGSVIILAGEKRAAGLLAEELTAKGIKAFFSETVDKPVNSGVIVTCGGLSGGFEIPQAKFILISHRYIASDRSKQTKRPKNAKQIGSLEELKQGDYVVHSSHGIGIFEGIKRITNGAVTKDYIKIKYAKTDVLYVPVTQLDLVSKYIGSASEDGGIKLNRLGSAEWQKTRSRVKKAVRDMAKQLTALYAKRMASKGHAFSQDTDLQNNFERRFEYDETDDQLRCIKEIKSDMERSVPMDRLLCGDVGFGKTEVALRAAFKCISEGKQCVLLVPTTILAMQHYNTIIRRFGDMPVTVKLMSRFVSASAQAKIITGLKNGRVDMIVGTHRIISKDVTFKNIGLVIIDEEQRFGVAQKERLKELYPFVDILTLSATPIPRTLNMALSGLRDMSAIDEAPGDRHPVQSYVLEYNFGVITDAISKEIRRGGQAYYLHNRVESIELCASKIKERLPEARIGIAHGKMGEDELTEVWRKLVEHEIDLLVCTTIIETGVDVPNANTLIIESADRMGLSQLHQLRGRVGRSPRRAYAYFCFEKGKQLSDIASKRLEAIREFTEFGAGFKIAMRDLEIRGAGSILGGEQHGNMEAVGYDMYLRLLSDAINEENGIEPKNETECTIDLNISAHIPESYIESLPARLGVYRRIADIRNNEDVTDVIDELCDRFGEPPKAVMGLIDISLLRSKASAAGITEITGNKSNVFLHISKINPEIAGKLSESFGNRFVLSAQTNNPFYTIKLSKGQKMSDLTAELGKYI